MENEFITFWLDGLWRSKTAALEREIAHGSPFGDAYRLALRLRREGSVLCDDHLPVLRSNMVGIAAPALATIERLLQPGAG